MSARRFTRGESSHLWFGNAGALDIATGRRGGWMGRMLSGRGVRGLLATMCRRAWLSGSVDGWWIAANAALDTLVVE